MPQHKTIAHIIQELEEVVSACMEEANPHGLFAALYLSVTRRVRDHILAGYFDDGARMEHFDVLFAQRYLDAWAARRAGQPTTAAWALAFDAAQRHDLLALQHLLLGMNAHINLDLGIAAATVAKGAPLDELEADFGRINDILLGQLEEVQAALNSISPLLRLLDWLLRSRDEQLAGFSLRAARTYAWHCTGTLYHSHSAADQAGQVARMDKRAVALAQKVVKPHRLLHWLIGWAYKLEQRDVRAQIRAVAAE